MDDQPNQTHQDFCGKGEEDRGLSQALTSQSLAPRWEGGKVGHGSQC